jgi:hypothetical protein
VSAVRLPDDNPEATIGRFRDAVENLKEAPEPSNSTGAREPSNSSEAPDSYQERQPSESLSPESLTSPRAFDARDLNGLAQYPDRPPASKLPNPPSQPVARAVDEGPAELVAAEQFVLVDKSGGRRAALALKADGGPTLTLHDSRGRTRATISLGADGAPSLVLYDAAGKRRLEVALKADGAAGVGLYDRNGEGRAELAVAETGAPGLCLYGPDGRRITKLPAVRGR